MPKHIKPILAMLTAVMVASCQTVSLDSAKSTDSWGPTRNGLRTRLQEIPNTYARGYLKLLSLTMENVSDKPIRYDDQQVAGNDSLIIKRNGVTPVPFRGEVVSTVGETKTIAPGNIVPLFYGLVVEEQYDISRPGSYTVQFRGLDGIGGNATAIPPSNIISIRMKR